MIEVNSQGPKAKDVQNLFGTIAGTYDKANDVITFGMARGWRKKLVKLSGVKPGDSVLDCATGTGDLAIEFKKALGENGRAVGTDFCQEMLDLAPAKAKEQNLDVEFSWADALDLPFKDNEFDVVSIAYGIRNVADRKKALDEMARVTKPGGHVMVLETGDTQIPIFKSAIGVYLKHIVPRLGGWVSGHRDAYDYLNKSSSQFPCGKKFIELMESTGRFSQCEYFTLMGGASFIYKGTVN